MASACMQAFSLMVKQYPNKVFEHCTMQQKAEHLSQQQCCFFYAKKHLICQTADSDTVSTYQVSSVQLVSDKKLEASNKAKHSLDLICLLFFLYEQVGDATVHNQLDLALFSYRVITNILKTEFIDLLLATQFQQ